MDRGLQTLLGGKSAAELGSASEDTPLEGLLKVKEQRLLEEPS